MSFKLNFGQGQRLSAVFTALVQKFLNWLLAEGEWDDTSQWLDTEEWEDGE